MTDQERAASPDTLPSTLEKLAWRYPIDTLDNPALSLLALEDFDAWSAIHREVNKGLRSGDTYLPPDFGPCRQLLMDLVAHALAYVPSKPRARLTKIYKEILDKDTEYLFAAVVPYLDLNSDEAIYYTQPVAQVELSKALLSIVYSLRNPQTILYYIIYECHKAALAWGGRDAETREIIWQNQRILLYYHTLIEEGPESLPPPLQPRESIDD